MTMIRCRGTILLFVAFVAALDSSAAAATAVTMITDYEVDFHICFYSFNLFLSMDLRFIFVI